MLYNTEKICNIMSGPLPQKQVRRRNLDQPGWVSLPSSGRQGPSPKWPIGIPKGKGAKAVWDDLWSLPQAVMWDSSERFVARYVFTLLAVAEAEEPSASLLSEIRQMEDRLGLSPKAMEALRWQIVDDTPAVIEPNDDDEVEDYL